MTPTARAKLEERPARRRAKNCRAVGPPGSKDQGGYQTQRDIPSICSLEMQPSQLVAETKMKRKISLDSTAEP
jgi:hypothetical protein